AVREHISGDTVVGQVRHRRGIAVVDLGVGRGRDDQGPGGDVGGGRGAGVEGVIAGISAADADAADGHRLTRADVLVGEGSAGVVVGEHVARDAVVRQRYAGRGHAVVDL